jgi:hypothetical protein
MRNFDQNIVLFMSYTSKIHHLFYPGFLLSLSLTAEFCILIVCDFLNEFLCAFVLLQQNPGASRTCNRAFKLFGSNESSRTSVANDRRYAHLDEHSRLDAFSHKMTQEVTDAEAATDCTQIKEIGQL